MILIVTGTNRSNANAKIIAETYSRILNEQNCQNEILDLEKLPDDFVFSALYENASKNPVFNKFQEKIDRYDKILFIVSEYNGSFPGVLKAFIDGLRYPDSLTDKKGALVGLSSGPMGSVLALSHMNDILSYLGMYVLPLRPRLSIIDKALKKGELIDEFYMKLLREQAESLINF